MALGYGALMNAMPPSLPSVADVVAFWVEAGPEKWFAKNESFDIDFKNRFTEAHFAAARRELDPWMDTAEGALALMILLDQFPRNAFRNTGHMFATDALALALSKAAIARGHHKQVAVELQPFILMPLMHSESLEDQQALVDMLDRDVHPNTYDYAVIHRDVIARFGRFPHRNDALGRYTTAEEAEFLSSGGFSG